MSYQYSDGKSQPKAMSGVDIAKLIIADPEGRHLVWSDGMPDWATAQSREDIAAIVSSLQPAVTIESTMDSHETDSYHLSDTDRKAILRQLILVSIVLAFIAILLSVVVITINQYLERRSDSGTAVSNDFPAPQRASTHDNRTYSAKTESYDVPGIYPQASTRILIADNVRALSKQELRIMRNEIYARHGYIFTTKKLASYFSAQSWYRPGNANVNNLLTDIERRNIDLIKKFER